jgi:hypothetical protein
VVCRIALTESADAAGKNDVKRITIMCGRPCACKESEEAMCSVGGPFGDEEIVWPKNYRRSAQPSAFF